MVLGIINIGLSLIEICVIYVSMYVFMKNNSRTVYHKKWMDIVSLIVIMAAAYGFGIMYPNGWGGIWLQLLLTILMGLWMFHRKALPIIMDVVYCVVIILGMECGIYIVNLLLSQVHIKNYLAAGSLNMAVKIIIMLPMAWAMIKWRKNQADSTLSLQQTLAVLVLPAFSLLFLYSLMEMFLVYVQLYGVLLVLVNIIALLLLNIYFLYLFGYLFQARRLEQEMKIFQVQNEAQFHYYEELERKYRESRKVFHDMKNHLQAVEQLYEENNKEAGDSYTQDLYHLLNKLGEKFYCSNHMLNIILNEKLSAATEAGVRVTAQVGDVLFDDMKDIDITTIFANLLDNAVEAASKAGEGAFLDLKVDTVQDFRVIHIRNSRSEKENQGKSHEGLGLVNVRCTLEKYHGSIELRMMEKEYRVSVMIPGTE